MEKKILFMFGCIVVLVAALLVGNMVEKAVVTKDTIKIGAVMPLTGKGAYLGESSLKGLKLAEKEINQKYGKNTIRLIVDDDQSNPAIAATIANKFIGVDNVDALYSETTAPSLAISPLSLQYKKPFLYSAFTPSIIEKNPYSIKSYIDMKSACQLSGKYAKDNSIEKIAIIDETGELGNFCVKGLKDYYNEENVLLINNLVDKKDLTVPLLKTKNADIIIFIGYEETALNLLEQKNQLGIKTPLMGLKDAYITDKIIKEIGIENLNQSVYYDVEVTEDFKKRYAQEYEVTDSGDLRFAAFSHNALWALFEAIKECKDNGINDSICVPDSIGNQKVPASGLINAEFKDRVLQINLELHKIEDSEIKKLN